MAKEDFILLEGIVAESLPNATFRVEVEGQTELVLCHLSGKMRKHYIKVLPGDRVIFEMSPYDLTKGRITRRLKPGEGLNQPDPTVTETEPLKTEQVAEVSQDSIDQSVVTQSETSPSEQE